MDLKKLFGMRPKTEAIPDIEAALAAARAAGEGAAKAEGELLQKRGDALLNGAPDDIARAEEALARARLDAGRAEAMAAALEARLADAMREKKLGELRGLVEEANRLADAAARAISSRYAPLAEALAEEVLRPEAEALAAIGAARSALEGARWGKDDAPELAELMALMPKAPLVMAWPAPPYHSQRDDLGQLVKLPSQTGLGPPVDDGAPIWPKPARGRA
jgi:hypothetical protein